MKRVVGVCVLGAIVGASGCSSPPRDQGDSSRVVAEGNNPPTTAPDKTSATPSEPIPPSKTVVAQINGQPITLDEVIKPLMEWRGLAFMLNVAQLDLAKQDAQASKVAVTPEDIKTELNLTLDKMFPDQPDRDKGPALEQYLEKRNYSRAEFDIVVELNAYLRKAAMLAVQGKITDDAVEKEFGIEYGETAKCRVIVVANAREVQEAQQRLKSGQDFAQVAKDMSRDGRTAPLGGEMQPFSLQTAGIPDQFRQLAFSLQPGQVSDPLNIGENWYLIKLEQKFPPKAVKFANVKDSLKKSMYDKLADIAMGQLRENIGARVMMQLSIHDPILASQFNALKAHQEGEIKKRDEMNAQWRRERAAMTQPATSQPASGLSGPPSPAAAAAAPAPATATQPATR